MDTSKLYFFNDDTQTNENLTTLLDINATKFYNKNRGRFAELSKNDEIFIRNIEKNISSFEKKIDEYESEIKTIEYDESISYKLERKLGKLNFEVSIISCMLLDKKNNTKVKKFLDSLTKIFESINNLHDCIYEFANFNEALVEIKNINHKMCNSYSGSEEDMFQFVSIIRSVELMLMVIKNPSYTLRLRSWLNISREKYFKYMKSKNSNDKRDMYYEEVMYCIQNIIEEDKKFQKIVCNGLCEAEIILEQLNSHQEEIIELSFKIEEYEKMSIFADESSFERGKQNLEVLLNDVNDKISKLSEDIENEKNFILHFIDIWDSWRHFLEFNPKNDDLDVSQLKNWKKEGQHIIDSWSLFKIEYHARQKHFLTGDELLDKLSQNGNDRLVDDYKQYVNKVIKKVTEDSFRFSLVGNSIDEIFVLKNFDETITELEESNINDSDVNIDFIVSDDINNLITEFDSIHINEANKRQSITIEIKELHHSEETSGIIDDHEDEGTIESDMTIPDESLSENSFEFYETDSEKRPISPIRGNLCISLLRVIFSTTIFAFGIFFIFVLYYGREEFLPCCLREFWWTHFRRNGRTPY
uniref:KASH domain-containing protein n=1 Tax=Strongyloides papillosus TaxID=174720 RepID=A0A0N5BIC0_STREA